MEQMLKANDNYADTAGKRIAMLEYMTDFLACFTRTAEALDLKSMAYFLAMAAVETNDRLRDLKAESVVGEVKRPQASLQISAR